MVVQTGSEPWDTQIKNWEGLAHIHVPNEEIGPGIYPYL